MDAGKVEIQASPTNLQSTFYATRLSKNGVKVETVEHVLAALYACGIDNAILELDGPEIPCLDGSSEPFVAMLQDAGREELPFPRTILRVVKPVSVLEGDKSIAVYPGRGFHVTYSIEYDHELLRFQKHSVEVTESSFVTEIAGARTYGFLKDVEAMRRQGLARGGSLENAVVVADHGYMNGGLRFDNECVRHKILDLVGDMALMGCRIEGHFVVHKGGHHMHTALIQKLLARRSAFQISGTHPAPYLTDVLNASDTLPAVVAAAAAV